LDRRSPAGRRLQLPAKSRWTTTAFDEGHMIPCDANPVGRRTAIRRLLLSMWVLLCASVAWGQGQPAVAPKAQEAEETTSAMLAKVSEPFTGDFEAMVKRRMIRVLTPYSKTGYFVYSGAPRGITYDLCKLLEANLNRKLRTRHLKVHVVVIPTPIGKLAQNLLEGKGDIVAAGVLVTELRLEQLDFTNPIRRDVAEVIVTGPGGPEIASVEDLSGKMLYTTRSWAYWKDMEELNAKFVKEGKVPLKLMEAPSDLNTEDMLEMVNAGIVPATPAHDYLTDFWVRVFPKLKVNKGAAVKTGGQVAWAIRKGSPQLKAELNAFIAKYPEGSASRNTLLANYLKNLKYAKEATSPQNRARLDNLRNLFQKYGDKYKMDYLLMVAQGYQESQLNQSAKSPVGAIGVMQVMPSTGQELKVGDISQVEPNIHAGVKYMRFMMDKYYGSEPNMTPLNKGLFAFASYNAGPARIAALRKKAAARGLDPNVWFNNVEVLAAEKIGPETVTYVSNIYKYYLGYKMLIEQRDALQKAKEELKKASRQK
jgi:membrane-bound lytic murein transglycosylase MltF